MSLWLATYDIAHGGRRASVARILAGYGRRVQRSVFEVSLEPAEVADLRREIGPHLAQDDRFDLYPIDERGPRCRIGWQRPPATSQSVILY